MANLSYYNVSCPMGAWSNTYQYKTQVIYDALGNGGILQCPTVNYDGNIYIANGFTSAGVAKQPTLGLIPPNDNAWVLYTEGPIANNYSSLLATLQSSAIQSVTDTETILPIANSSNFNALITGNGIILNPNNSITLAANQIWSVTLSVQGSNFLTVQDQLQLYYSISTNNGNSYTDAPAPLRVTSVGLLTGGDPTTVGSGMTGQFIFNTTSNGYNQSIRLLMKVIMVQSSATASINYNNPFNISIHN